MNGLWKFGKIGKMFYNKSQVVKTFWRLYASYDS